MPPHGTEQSACRGLVQGCWPLELRGRQSLTPRRARPRLCYIRLRLPSSRATWPPASPRAVWICSLAGLFYFSEGLPYGVVTELLPLYLRTQHVSLGEIGLLSTVSLAWTMKLFWAPLVDRYGTYRRWIAASLVTMLAVWVWFATAGTTTGFWIAVTILALASATQDVAVDAMTITITPAKLLGVVNSTRVAAYRLAIILAGGGFAALATRTGWSVPFAIAAGVALALLLLTRIVPPNDRSAAEHPRVIRGIRTWLARPDGPAIFGVVLLYRFGDGALAPMLKPYWVDRGFSPAEIGTVTTVFGIGFFIIGAIAGGAFVTRYGVHAALLWLGMLQILSNVGYAVVATTSAGRPGLYAASIIENFTGGLGTAAFLAFLMAVCEKENAATEYALLTALYGLTRSLVGTASGFATESLGYATYFWLTVLLGVPALFLLDRIRATAEAAEPR